MLIVAACLPANAQWEMQNSNTKADLRGIHAVGGGVAWASGSKGTVLRTEDGGYVWQTCAMPPEPSNWISARLGVGRAKCHGHVLRPGRRVAPVQDQRRLFQLEAALHQSRCGRLLGRY